MNTPLTAARDRFAQANPERRVVANGREWGFTRIGESGPALVLIPGTLGHGDIFWQPIERLRDRARILALTYPHSGGIADWAEDLAELMDRAGFGTATVLGSSLGGVTVQYFAAVHPERVETMVAANTLSSAGEIAALPQYANIDGTSIEELRAGIAERLRERARSHPDQAELSALLLRELEVRISEASLRTRLKALRFAPELPEIALPRERIVTVESDDDPMMTPAMRARVRARLNPGRSVRFASGGHFPYVTRPDEYARMLEQALGV